MFLVGFFFDFFFKGNNGNKITISPGGGTHLLNPSTRYTEAGGSL